MKAADASEEVLFRAALQRAVASEQDAFTTGERRRKQINNKNARQKLGCLSAGRERNRHMKSRQTIKLAALPAMLALAAFGLLLAASPATAAPEHKLTGVINSITYADYHAGYSVFNETGTGTVVGNFSAVTGVHFTHNATKARGWWTITANNGDLLNVVFEQTGSFATGYWAGPYTIVGGTGRFANASGTGTIVVISDLTTGSPLSGSFDGTISF